MKTPQILLALTTIGCTALTSCRTTETDQDLFIKADTNKDGRLSRPEVNAFGLPRLYGRFDRDGDGSVTLADVRAVDPVFEESQFTERDLNQDGKVTFGEYRTVAQKKKGLDKVFDGIDSNHDNQIDRSEADAYLASLETPPKS